MKKVMAFAIIGVSWVGLVNAAPTPDLKLLQVRDPFKRPTIKMIKEAPRSELEMFPVAEFKLVGVVTGLKKPRAMVQAPNTKTYVITEGTKIGSNRGVVYKVTTDTIYVREKTINVLGQEENIDLEIHYP